MVDLAGRPPLGLKQAAPPKQPRKPLPKRSAKRKAYMRSAARVDGVAHMMRVKALGCMICGDQAEFHHEAKPRSDMRGLPLCPPHHRREFGVGAYHYSPKAFYALHGTSEELLGKVSAMLAGLLVSPVEPDTT
jgi:hypothetical protein